MLYRIGSLWVFSRLWVHLHTLESGLIAHGTPAEHMDGDALTAVGGFVRAYLDEPEPTGKIDLATPRKKFRRLKKQLVFLSICFGCCAGFFGAAMVMIARGLLIS